MTNQQRNLIAIEQERLAYISGDIRTANLLAELIKATEEIENLENQLDDALRDTD